jgi:hypothetical protein
MGPIPLEVQQITEFGIPMIGTPVQYFAQQILQVDRFHPSVLLEQMQSFVPLPVQAYITPPIQAMGGPHGLNPMSAAGPSIPFL